MGKTIKITQGPRAQLQAKIAGALELLRDGKVLVAPAENAYVFVCDAFNHTAVKKIHQLRGDGAGVAAQVMVGNISTIEGITAEFTDDARALATKFWPGLLTMQLSPQRGLIWDLGDHRELDQIAIRIPSNRFLLELTGTAGPLAVASASLAGRPPSLSTIFVPALDADIGATFEAGELSKGLPSTIVAISADKITLLRKGAISLTSLRTVLPNIADAS